MDNIQNSVNDYIKSPTEKANELAKKMTEQIITEKYSNGYTSEIYNSIYDQQLEIAKQKLLDEMKFEQDYKRQRHIGDMDSAEFDMDRFKHNSEQQKILQQSVLQDKLYTAEAKLITDDIGGININQIVDHYRDLAEKYNEEDKEVVVDLIREGIKNPTLVLTDNNIPIVSTDDENKLKELIHKSIENNDEISFSDIHRLIPDNKIPELSSLSKNNNGKINFKDLLSSFIDKRIRTSKEYMDVATQDIKARTDGIDMKLSSINNVRHTGITNENYYENHIDRMQNRKETLVKESKGAFYKERENQRQQDTLVRETQINQMNASNAKSNDVKQMITESIQNSSIGGIESNDRKL